MVRRLALADSDRDLPALIHELAEAGDSLEIEEDGRVIATLQPGTETDNGMRTAAVLVGALEGLPEEVIEQFLEDVASARGRDLPAPIDFDE